MLPPPGETEVAGMTPDGEKKGDPAGATSKKRRSLGLSRHNNRKNHFKSPIIEKNSTCGRSGKDSASLTTANSVVVVQKTGLALQPDVRTNRNTLNSRSVEQSPSTELIATPNRNKTNDEGNINAETEVRATCHARKSDSGGGTSKSLNPCNKSSSIDRTSHLSTPSSSRKRPSTNRSIFGKKFKTDFKSPVREVSKKDSAEDIKKSIDDLKEKIGSVDDQVKNLEQSGCDLKEAQTRIVRLHEYNELKDLGQFLIGQIASKEGTTTKQVYGRFGLDLDD